MGKQQVFVSYSSEDGPLVERLVAYLETHTYDTIQFFIAHRDLEFGRPWEERILSQLEKADLVLSIFSAKALESGWVLFEAGFARGRDLRVIPLALPGQTVSSIPRPLGSLQGVDLHSPQSLGKLIKALNGTLKDNHSHAVSDPEFQKILGGSSVTGRAHNLAPSGLYHVFSMSSGSRKQREPLEIDIDGIKMIATTASWESIGHLIEKRYVGRFKYSRGSSPSDLGTHEFHWTGTEFIGRAQSDSNKWKNETLVWRPADSVPCPAEAKLST